MKYTVVYLNASSSSLLQTWVSTAHSPAHPVGSLGSLAGRQVGKASPENARQTSVTGEQESQ